MRSYSTIGGKGRVLLSFDDYHPLNLKVDEILHKQGLEATFFIETASREARDQIKQLFELGHEIGGHTIHHPSDLKALHQVEAMGEIQGCKGMIEAITHRPCESFAYPRGRQNDDIVEMVRRSGFKDARTTHVLKTSPEDYSDPMRLPTTIHLFEGRKEYNVRPLLALARFYLDHVVKNGGTFHVWGHAFELERDNLWTTLEELVILLGHNIEV